MKSLQKTIVKAGIIALGLSPIISNAQFITTGSITTATNIPYTNANVGIGTVTPNARLQFDNSVNSRKIVMYEMSNSDHDVYGFGVNGYILRYQVPQSANHVFYVGNGFGSGSSTEVMRIGGNGNVGIGTSTPTQTLQVAGTISGTNFVMSYGAANGKILQSDAFGRAWWVTAPTASQWVNTGTCGNDIYYNPTVSYGCTKNVGIGTSTPAFILDVNGTFNASGISSFQTDVNIGGTLNSNNIANSSNIHTANMIVDSYIQIGGQPKDGSGTLVPAGIPTGFGLSVKGKIYCQEVNVTPNDVSNWADYVFKSDYKLISLTDVEKYIKENGHLENVPSAEDVVKAGYKVGEMDATLLRKVEELTLYVLELKKENESQQKEITEIKAKK